MMKIVIRDIFFEIHVEYPKHLFNGVALSLHSDLPFLTERNKIKNYVVHVRALKQALNQSWINTKKSSESNSI